MCQIDKCPGHAQIKIYLKKLLLAPPSALLFEGPRGVNKSVFAKAFAQSLLLGGELREFAPLSHPDLREFHPEGKILMHPVQSVRNLIDESRLFPYESRRRVFIIYEADRMLPSSSNALLKTLEEPPSYAHFILVTSYPQWILPTVLSRCFKVTFSTLAKEKDDGLRPLIAEIVAAALHQNYPLLFPLVSKLDSLIERDRVETIQNILSLFYYWYRDLHLLKMGGDGSLLFFREEEKTLNKTLSCPLPNLAEIQKRMRRIQEALTCQINLRSCLIELLI